MKDTFLERWCSTLGTQTQKNQLYVYFPQLPWKAAGEQQRTLFSRPVNKHRERQLMSSSAYIHRLMSKAVYIHNRGNSFTFYPINTLAGCRAKEGPHEHCHS